MNVKHRVSAATIAIAATLLAVTACSSGGNASSGSAGSGKDNAASARTYSASDLPKILTTAKKDLGVSGTVLNDAKVKSQISKYQSSGALSKLLSSSKAKIQPASCSTIVKKNLTTTIPEGTSISSLTYGTGSVSVVTAPGKTLPSTYTSKAQSVYDTAQKAGCTSMKLTIAESGETLSLPITLSKKAVTTDADRTSAIEERITMPSFTGGPKTAVTMLIVNAVEGNLGITAQTYSGAGSTATASPTPDTADVVNAVIAAAKKH